jgi:TPR repeat protein
MSGKGEVPPSEQKFVPDKVGTCPLERVLCKKQMREAHGQNQSPQGSASELYRLGLSYHHGDGVPRSFDLAYKHYIEADALGCPHSKFTLYCLFHDHKDYQKSAHWCLAAAMSGDLAAQASLVYVYRAGIYGSKEPDVVEAFAWGNLTICQKEAQSESWSDWRKSFRSFEATLTPDQIRMGEARSVELFARIKKN